MATRTIANAGGNWSATGTWVEGAVPTASDDVVATATSGALTLDVGTAACRSADFTNYVSTFAMATYNLAVGTSSAPASNVALNLVSGMTVTGTAYTSTFKFVSTVTGLTVTTNSRLGNTLGMSFAGTGGGWTIQDTSFTMGNLSLTNGTLNLNNSTATYSSISIGGTSTRTITFGSSNITISGGSGGAFGCVSTGLTVTTNTATIKFNSSSAPSITPGGVNFNGLSFVVTGQNTFTSTQGFTCANFSFTPGSGTANVLSLGASITVTGTLTLTGAAPPNRILIASSTVGASQTITCNGTVTATYCDFRDITGAGTASWDLHAITGGAGDCQGNSGITFTTAQTNYYKALANANFSVSGNWYLATNGGGGAGRVPLPQDTAIFDANSGVHTYTFDTPRFGTLTCTGFTGTFSIITIAIATYGNITWMSGGTLTATQALYLMGRGSQTIQSNSKHYGENYYLQAIGGTYTQQDNLSCSIIYLTAGTWTANNFNVSAAVVSPASVNATYPVIVNMGSGTWTLANGVSGQTPWNFATTTGMTINCGTSTITIACTIAGSWTFAGGGFTYYNLVWQDSSDSQNQTFTMTGNNHFNSIAISSYSTYTRTLTLTASSTQTTASLSLTGASSSNQIVINSSTGGTAATFSVASGIVAASQISLQDNTASGGAKFYAGLGSTIGTNVTGWNIGNPPSGGTLMMMGMG